MSNIISISLNDEILESIEELQKNNGYSGRSEIIRAGLRALIEEEKRLSEIKGNLDCVMIVMHEEKNTNDFSKIKHKYHSIVKTQIHQDIKDEKCLEILIINGASAKLKEFVNELKISKKIDNLKVIIS